MEKDPNIFDITFTVSDQLPIWPGSVPYSYHWSLQMPVAANNQSSFQMDSHLGTHLDAPLHFVNEGRPLQEIDLDKLIGKAWVAEIRDTKIITAANLEAADIPADCRRLLLKTDNQFYWQEKLTTFQEDFCAIDKDAAQWIVDKGIVLVGIDYLSIQRFQDGPETHQVLLNAEIVIVETLNLQEVTPGLYELICLPLKLTDIEASPVRAVLRKIETSK